MWPQTRISVPSAGCRAEAGRVPDPTATGPSRLEGATGGQWRGPWDPQRGRPIQGSCVMKQEKSPPQMLHLEWAVERGPSQVPPAAVLTAGR